MRTGQHYVLRDVDRRGITEAEGKQIVKEGYKIDLKPRNDATAERCLARRRTATAQESQKSQSAPTSRPVIDPVLTIVRAWTS